MNFGFSLPNIFRKKDQMAKYDLSLILALALLTLIYCGFYAQFHVDPHHDGIILKPASDILHGRYLFRDTFTQYGALTTLIHSGFMAIFGETLLALRWSAVVAYALISVLLYKIWRTFFSPFITFGLGLFWLATAYFPNQSLMVPFLGWSSVYALLFQLLAIWCVQQFLVKQNRGWLVAAGVSAALTFWVRQPVGMLLAAAITVFLVTRLVFLKSKTEKLLDLSYFLSAIVLTCVPFLVWLASFGGVHDWWEQSLVLAFDFGNRLSRNYSASPILQTLLPSISVSKKNLLWLSTVVATWLLAAVTGLQVLLNGSKTANKTWIFLLLAMTGLASWLQFFPANDQSHFFWAASPLIGITVYVVWQTFRFIYIHGAEELKFNQVKQWAWLPIAGTVVFVAASAAPFGVTALKSGKYYLTNDFVTVTEPTVISGLRVESGEAEVLANLDNKLDAYFTSYPDKKYLNVSPDALYGMVDDNNFMFHKQHVYWDWATQTIFPEYPTVLADTIVDQRPLLLVRETVAGATNYCKVDVALHRPIRMHTFHET